MSDENDSSRTESPTPRRQEQAREEGQVARSRELSTSLTLLSAGLLFYAAGPSLVQGFARIVRIGLSVSSADAFDTNGMLNKMATLVLEAIGAVAPLFIVLVIVAVLGPMLVGGWNISAKALQPDFTRLSPMRGLGNIFSWQGIGELAKAVMKAALVGLAAVTVFWNIQGELFGLAAMPVDLALSASGNLLVWAFLMIGSSLALVAAADVPFQIWRHNKGLSMTREEVRKEMRETDGDPQMKARIRSEQRARARARMMQEVPKADVIVTNPLHYAVALSYKSSSMRAPTVVAKGAELMAARIRDLGTAHGVPVLQAPPLARALYFNAEVGQEIPGPLYNAVAQVLAYVHQLRYWRDMGGRAPNAPTELPVPAELDPQSRQPGRQPSPQPRGEQ
jgi:flagellar biosynthetic protein FlhB